MKKLVTKKYKKDIEKYLESHKIPYTSITKNRHVLISVDKEHNKILKDLIRDLKLADSIIDNLKHIKHPK